MANLRIEGDLTQISENQLKYLRNVIEKLGYSDNTVTFKPLGQAGDNYIANVKRITVEDGKGSTFKMVAKFAPTNETQRQTANTELLFRNEHVMYTQVLPKFTEIEKAAEVPPQERLRYATCYGSSNEAPNEVILLEDLNEANFIMLDRFKPISNECVKSVLRNFAALHALSYALKYKEPIVFNELKNNLFDMWASMAGQEQVLMYFKQAEFNAANAVDSEKHKKAIDGAVTGSIKEIKKMSAYEIDSKHAVIQQGDAWTNNIMFKFDNENLLESVMIDYQLSKPTNPVADILYMIFNCTDYEMRRKYYYDWIDYYHSELEKYLSNYGLKASFVFPRDQLDVDLKRYGKVVFGLSLLLAGILSMKTEEAAKMKDAMEKDDMDAIINPENVPTDNETIVLFKKRIEGLVDSYLEFGLI